MTQVNDRTIEVIKFAVPLLAFAVGYGVLQQKVSGLEVDVGKHEEAIVTIKENNHVRDVETASFRANITNRVTNIETLTIEIHEEVVNAAVND